MILYGLSASAEYAGSGAGGSYRRTLQWCRIFSVHQVQRLYMTVLSRDTYEMLSRVNLDCGSTAAPRSGRGCILAIHVPQIEVDAALFSRALESADSVVTKKVLADFLPHPFVALGSLESLIIFGSY